MLNCFMLIRRCLIYNELSDAVAEFMAGDKCDSVNVHQEEGPFTLQGMCKKRFRSRKKNHLTKKPRLRCFSTKKKIERYLEKS